MECVERYFKKLDFIGHEFKFERDESTRHQTIYGAFFSLIVFVVAFVIIIFLGKKYTREIILLLHIVKK